MKIRKPYKEHIDSLKLQLHKPPYNSQEIAKSTNVQTSTYGYPQIPKTFQKYQTWTEQDSTKKFTKFVWIKKISICHH